MANQQMSPDQMKAFNKVLEERITEANQDKTKTKIIRENIAGSCRSPE